MLSDVHNYYNYNTYNNFRNMCLLVERGVFLTPERRTMELLKSCGLNKKVVFENHKRSSLGELRFSTSELTNENSSTDLPGGSNSLP